MLREFWFTFSGFVYLLFSMYFTIVHEILCTDTLWGNSAAATISVL